MSNIVEMILRAYDEVTGPTQKASASVTGFVDLVKKGSAAIGVAFSLHTLIEETVHAQNALAQLDIAFRNSTEGARLGKDDMIAFAKAAVDNTAFTGTAVTKAETILLRFGRVTGDVFERARVDILDVAAALGEDLDSAAQTVGRALQAPEVGLRSLSSMGVVFSATQRQVITSLVEAGKTAEAQQIILRRLEDTYGGAAKAARGTLGGALESLKNNFLELFETSDKGAKASAGSINDLAKVVGDPEFKTGVQEFTGELLSWAGAFVDLTAKAVKGWQLIFQLAADGVNALMPDTAYKNLLQERESLMDKITRADNKSKEMQAQGYRKAFTEAEVGLADLQKRLDAVNLSIKSIEASPGTGRPGEDWIRAGAIGGHARSTASGGIRNGMNFVSDDEQQQKDADALQAALNSLTEIHTNLAKIDQLKVDPFTEESAKRLQKLQEFLSGKGTGSTPTKLIQEFGDEAQSSGEKTSAQFERTKVLLTELNVSEEEYNKTIGEIIDSQLKMIDLNQLSIHKMIEPISDAKATIREFVDTVKEGLTNMAQAGETSGRALLRYILSALESKLIFRAIDKLGAYLEKSLTKATTNANGSGKSSGFGSFVGSFIGALFGAAGGGETSDLTLVGENGPEVVSGRRKVWNTQQLKFAMGNSGGSGRALSLALGDTNITIQGNTDEATLRVLEQRQRQMQKQTLKIVSDKLRDNGFGSLR